MIKAVGFNKNQAAFLFKIVPFLLHTNHPDLPGFIGDKECPFGISLFNPEKTIDPELFKRYFPTSTALRQSINDESPPTPCIHSLKTIGSIGTIAQTEKSDCDYWVSIRHKELGPERIELLSQKCREIEEWSLERGYEIYFFLMDIDQTRENSFESMAEDESAGSAIKLLLKDELFRSHIVVAGKILLWWFIPPGLTDKEYRAYVDKLYQSKKINPNLFIDLGYLSDIPKAEIFGACLWQMNKALDSPFKSVIKFAYLELLLKVKAKTLPLFSDKIKCLVTFQEKLAEAKEEKLAVEDVDPYLLLAKELVAFYQQEETKQKQDEIIRECLFMKTLEGVESQKRKKGKSEQLQKTMKLMQKWQLLPHNYSHISKMRFWKFKDYINAGSKVHDYLIETYKGLRWIFKSFDKETGLTITERDVAVLGRKLFTFYEKKPDKIEYIRSLSRETMAQDDITIHITRYEGMDYFYAFQGAHDHLSIKNKADMVIRRENKLVQLLTWLFVNGILNKKTSLHLTKNYLPVSLADIQDLIDVMTKTFPQVHFAHISGDQLLRAEKIVRALIVINLFKEPVRGSKTLNSTIISANSYGEYFIRDYTTQTQLKNAMRVLLTQHFVSRWNKNLEIFIPPFEEQRLILNMLEK